jgi:iron complex transport system ATP-binding protein
MISDDNTVIEICNLSFSINQIPILKNINLNIQKGEFIGLIGPNGAGKTTLLKCINGINKAQGTIKIKNKDINHLSDKEIALNTALMSQNTSISFPFHAIDIVMMGRYPHLKRMQFEGKEDFRIARGNMEYTSTLKFENKPITQISGGERQRVLFAKVLTQQTEIMMLDEPTASLDIKYQEQIFDYSKEFQNSGNTIIAAVHDLKIASRYCSRLILMRAGEIIADGTPGEVLTSENIYKAYGVHAIVYKNPITGLLDFCFSNYKENKNREKIHIIGGGGSASGVLRYLFEKGYNLSAGVLSNGDSDHNCTEIFGIDCVETRPFCEIDELSFTENCRKIMNSDITILCSMPFGIQNLKNLEAAKFAKKLIIIEDDAPETRDYTGGLALEIYDFLKRKAIVTTSAKLHEVI